MSKENIEKLRELKNDIESVEKSHGDILELEPLIARPLHDALLEARRKVKQVE